MVLEDAMVQDNQRINTRMKQWPSRHWVMSGFAVILLLLAACGPSTPTVPIATATDSPASMTPTSTATSEPTPTQELSFQSATYQDDVAGFEFDYPASWTVGPSEQYSRGGITAFSSWSRPNDVLPDETPPGETRLDVAVMLWDPINDLDAYVEQRMRALLDSGLTLVSQETWSLTGGRTAEVFVVESNEGRQFFFFFTTIADKYLVLSGDGALTLLAEIAKTVR
jgi:hypothetical protein